MITAAIERTRGLTEEAAAAAGSADPPKAADAWLHVVSHLDPKYGGLSAVVPELARAVAEATAGAGTGPRPAIAAFCAPGEQPGAIADVDVTAWPTSRLAWLRDGAMRDSFETLVGRSAGVHIHGLWEGSTWAAVRAARRAGRPYVISAHGMLEPWALRNKRWKKEVYAALFERGHVAGATALHALTEAEVEDYRRFGARQPIAVIPNGVTIPDRVGPELFLAQHPGLRGKRVVLFLGRIHFKKGLDLLVEAWSQVAGAHPDARLVLAGPDFEGTRAVVERQIAERGVGASVCFTGMLRGAEKWSAMAAAEAFVLPSYSEGLSVSALEAMGMGLPVILTTHCHLPEAARAGAGWEIPSEAAALTSVLQQLLRNPTAENRAMGANGQRLVRERFRWSVVGAEMRAVYTWAAGATWATGAQWAAGVEYAAGADWVEGGPEPAELRLRRMTPADAQDGGTR